MNDQLTEQEIRLHLDVIDTLTQYQCAKLQRFAPSGHPFFREPLYPFFKAHFEKVGGMTPEISKAIGWDK